MIQRMRATFGCLEDRELTLQPGLNVISGDNESGKSTWQAFLLAMLYGVDTRARERADFLPDKLRYLPWNGKPMGGTLELIDEGRTITLERSSRSGPMSEFRAWDSASGSPLDNLTGASCGKTLLGVEAAVYTRSGFLRQRQAAVSADATLEKRLSALVTAGSEDFSYSELDEKLKKMQTALRHNRGGRLPQAEARRTELRQRLDEITQKQTALAELHALRQERAQTCSLLEGLDALERQAQLSAAEQALQEAVDYRMDRERACARLPDLATLEQLNAEIRQLKAEQQRAEQEAAARVPPADPLFDGLDPRQVHEKVLADANTVRQAAGSAPVIKAPALLWLLGILPALALLWLGLTLPSLLPLLGGGLLILAALGLCIGRYCVRARRVNAYLAQQQEARDILAAYETDRDSGILERGMQYLQALARLEEPDPRQALQERADALLQRLQAIRPDCESLFQIIALLDEHADTSYAYAKASMEEERQRAELARLRTVLGEPRCDISDPALYAGRDHATEAERLRRLDAALEERSTQAARLCGAIDQMGDSLALHAELEALNETILRMEARYAALELARNTLGEANEALRARFAPLLCQRSGELFSRLTDGAYDRVQLDRSMRVTVRPGGSAIYRPLSYLSGGAVDQLYLALRLAICELLLPDAPIVLDDALVFFDDHRAALALQTLQEMSKTRQILLFTSQSREKRLLEDR